MQNHHKKIKSTRLRLLLMPQLIYRHLHQFLNKTRHIRSNGIHSTNSSALIQFRPVQATAPYRSAQTTALTPLTLRSPTPDFRAAIQGYLLLLRRSKNKLFFCSVLHDAFYMETRSVFRFKINFTNILTDNTQ